MVQLKRWLLHKYLKIRTTLPFVYLCNKAYINQDTNQVGFISNGVDEGYQFKLPGALQKIAFTVEGIAYIESTNLFGYEFSNELITDRNALKFNYPQGTTDMCGNAI
ncbi:DUF4882 family protein [Acinetobacter baumannii]|uniref:DUF4882 family protein n=1 Tax=Acinetobacter baumannii TaxID=470 RepID=UPI002412A92E|nr:DUF4882 family protein [Acinetobacter baumannii]